MEWVLSTKGCSYYIDELGNYLTVDSQGNVINISPLLTLDPSETGKIIVRKIVMESMNIHMIVEQ